MINKTQEEIMKDWNMSEIDTPLVSVKCMTYNQEKYIGQCIDGFLMQKTSFPFEILIHDDCSTDNTTDIVLAYAKKFPKIIKPILEDENQYSKHDGSHHKKIDAAIKGKYIALCEGDDYWIDENKLQRQFDFLEKYDDCSLDSENSEVLYLNSDKKSTFSERPESYISIDELLKNRQFATGSVMYRRELYEEYVNINAIKCDTFLWAFCSTKGKIHYRPVISSVYRRGTGVTENNKIKWFFSSRNINKSIEKYFTLSKDVKKIRRRTLYIDLLYAIREALYKKQILKLLKLGIYLIFYSIQNFCMLWCILANKFYYYRINKYNSRKCKKDVKKLNNNNNIIVSLTSYPLRYNYLYRCLVSIFSQTVKPRKIVLVIYEEEKNGIPEEVLNLTNYGLEIKYVNENLKPHKKYYYTMKEYPDDIIITVDDDSIYDKNLIKRLLKSYKKYPKCVSAGLVHRMTFDESGNINLYSQWEKSYKKQLKPSNELMAIGVGGVLYPPIRSLGMEGLFNKELINKLCLCTDDIWLKYIELNNKVPVVWVKSPFPLPCPIKESSKTGLFLKNANGGQNDFVINQIETHLGIKFFSLI